MSPLSSVVLMVSNYSHDIATAFLAVSGVTMWLLSSIRGEAAWSSEADLLFIRTYEAVKKIARYSLEWIIIAGVPRIIFYREFEWSAMSGDLQVVAIIIKHVVMFTLVGGGLYYWSRLNKRVGQIRMKLNIS